jgi:hypothetical protein
MITVGIRVEKCDPSCRVPKGSVTRLKLPKLAALPQPASCARKAEHIRFAVA